MRILLVGASGFIGRHLADRLRHGHQLLWAARTPPPSGLSNVTHLPVDLVRDTDAADWLPRLAGVDAVVNAAGLLRERGTQSFEAIHMRAPIALFDACAARGVRRVVQVSALGADEQARSAYHRSKKAADDHLRRLPLSFVIVQPSLVFGADGASATLFCQLAALPLLPLPGRGEQQVQPVHIDDLVALLGVLIESTQVPARIAATGPHPMALRDFLHALRKAMQLPPTLCMPVPMPLMRIAARLGTRLRGALLDTDTLQMLERGNSESSDEMARVLGRRPRDVAAFIEQGFERNALRSRALLGWLLPLLRISIAIVWLVTAWVSAFIYPEQESYRLLARTGIEGALAPVALYGAALLDGVFGLLSLVRPRRWLWLMQIALILGYTLLITLYLPEFWAHPYGPLLKNLPLLAALWLLLSFERR